MIGGQPAAPRSRLLLCAIAKDETAYLAEWIDYHLGLGFDRIVIYDNESAIPIKVAPAQRGRVRVRSWKTRPGRAPQLSAYNHCLLWDGWRFDWLMYLDLDEFLNLHKHPDVRSFLADFTGYDGVAINWRLFGSAGMRKHTAGPVTRRFTRASPVGFEGNDLVKTIFRPRAVKGAAVHCPHFKRWAKLANADGRSLETAHGHHNTARSYEVAQVNHYFTKSYEEFQAKRARGRGDLPTSSADKFRTDEMFEFCDRNEEEDTTILRHPAAGSGA